MRTTLTLESDVAALLRRLLKSRRATMKQLVNAALRRGLRQLEEPPGPRPPFRTSTFDGGRCLLDNVDNVAEVLALAEGENYK
jgi:hypothetical protein